MIKLNKQIIAIFFGGFVSFIAYAQENINPLINNDSIKLPSKEELQLLDNIDIQMEAGNYATAKKDIKDNNIPPIAAAERLKVWADKGITPAMWMVAEQYRLANRHQESANWTYAAFLGTRIDSSLCINQQAAGLERSIISSFYLTVQSARQDPMIMRDAIVFASQKQKSITNSSRKPKWICLLVDYPKNTTGVVSTSEWDYKIAFQIKKFDDNTTRKEQ